MAKFIISMISKESYQAEADNICDALGAMLESVVDAGNFEDIKLLSEEVYKLEASCVISALYLREELE